MRNRLSNTQLMFNTLVRDSRTDLSTRTIRVWIIPWRKSPRNPNWASNFRKNRTAKMIMDPKYIYVEMFTELRFFIMTFSELWWVVRLTNEKPRKHLVKLCLCLIVFVTLGILASYWYCMLALGKAWKTANNERVHCEHSVFVMFARS